MTTSPAVGHHETRSDSRIVARNGVVQLARYGGIWGANAALVLFLPRYLGADGLGQLQFALSFASLFSVLVALGVRQYLIKEIARDQTKLPRLLNNAIGLRGLAAIVSLGLIVAVTEVSSDNSVANTVVYLAAVAMVLTSFAQLFAATLHGLERMGWESFSEVVSKILIVSAGVVLLLNGGTVRGYATILLAGAGIQFLLNAGFVSRLTPLRMSLDKARLKELVVGGSPYILVGFLLGAYTNSDIVMLRYMTADSVVGWHAAAFQITGAVNFLPTVLATAALPTLARLYKTNRGNVALMARTVIRVTFIAMAPLTVGLALVSAEVIAIFPYPEEFNHSVPVLTVMSLTALITALLITLGTVAIAVDRQRWWAIALAFTVGLNIVINLALIPYAQRVYGNGAIGAAVATLVTELFMAVAAAVVLANLLRHRGLLMALGKICVSISLMAAAVVGGKSGSLGLWSLIAIGAATYAVAAMTLGVVSRAEIKRVVQIVAHRGAVNVQATASPKGGDQ